MADKLTHPEHGRPIDTNGKPVTTDPIPGGHLILNGSLPTDHEAHAVWREDTPAEKRDREKARKANVAFNRADAMLFLRMTRDAMLRATDHFETLPNAQKIAGTKAKLDAWLKWRQQLRDLPAKVKKTDEPEDVSWPQPPAAISSLVGHARLWPKLDWTKLHG